MKKKNLYSILAVCLLIALCAFGALWLFRGDGGHSTAETTGPTEPPKAMMYTIELTGEDGTPVEGVGIYVYTDSTLAELVWFAKTDANGAITFSDVESDSFTAVVEGVPEGYEAEETYTLTGGLTQIVLSGGLAKVDDLASMRYELGDKIGDFTITTPYEEEYTLSQLLKTKKAVVLNFWYAGCAPCKAEFPFMQEAYQEYKEQLEILAMDPVDTDNAQIASYRSENGLSFPMAVVDPAWADAMQLTAYPTTVVIDRYGTIALIHKGSIPDKQTFLNIFDFFTSDSYQQTVVRSVDDLPEVEDTKGSKDDPYEFGGVTSFEVKVRPGKTAYVNIYKVNNLYMQISSPDAYVIYNDTLYEAKNGSVGLVINAPDTFTPVSLQIGNSGTQAQTFTVSLGQFPGTLNNPYPFELGDFAASVNAGNSQGVYFAYTSQTDGVLEVRCTSATSGVDYDFALYNLSTYAYRNYSSDGSVDEDGYPILKIQVNAGNTIQFSVSTLPDSSNNYPSGTFGFRSAFHEGETLGDQEQVKNINYSITVTDENRQPLPKVFFSLTVDGVQQSISTDEKGVATVKLPAGTYRAALVLPEGYTVETTEYILSEAVPSFSVKLKQIIHVTKTYTVKVVDEEGKPIPNALVSVGPSFAYTDAEGIVSFTLDQDDYTALIAAPSGYYAESAGYPFEKDATELTIVLKEGSGEDQSGEKKDYTVTVTDYDGKPVTGVVVQFLKNGELAAMQNVDDKGVAKVNLPAGSYTVVLAFSGETFYYEEKDAVLTSKVTGIELKVAPAISSEPTELYVGKAYEVGLGGTYVTMQSNVVNYYIFKPTASGTYQFTTSDPEALISYWGSSTSYIADMTSGTDYKDNVFTLNIKETNLGATPILGITGADDCILQITRIGDAVLDDSDVAPEVYTPKTEPKAFTLTGGGTLTYLDLTAKTDAYKLVLNSADGYYHLGTKDGPVLYVNLGEDAPYVSMYNLLGFQGYGGTGLTQSFYDESGKLLRKEDYTECMMEYVKCIDETYGVYPLNEDLAYMLQQAGDYKGWWDSTNGNYLFKNLNGFNPELGWLFPVCYVK